MQNTTEKVAVETKTEAAPVTETAAEQTMAEQLQASAPEKRRVFRKACNHTARSALLQMLIMGAVVAIVMVVYMAVAMLSNDNIIAALTAGDMTAFEGLLIEMLSSSDFVLWTFIATAIGGTAGNIIAGVLHSKKRGCKAGESFKEGRMTLNLFSGGAVVGIGAMYLWAYLYAIIQHLTGYADPLTSQSGSQAEMFLSVEHPVMMAVYCAYVCLLAPITEEYLYRGVLLKTLSKYNVPFAAFATSLIFGLMHGNLNQTPGTFLFGLVMAYITVRSGSIRTPIILHMLLNIYSTVMSALLINIPESAQTLNIVGLILNILFIVGAIAIVIAGLVNHKLKWEAIEPATNHTLLPKANSRVKFHLGHFFTCFWVLLLIYICVETILLNAGFTPIFELALNAINAAIAA